MVMQREGKKHFGCDNLVGVELENQGGESTALQHWEKRILGVSQKYRCQCRQNLKHVLRIETWKQGGNDVMQNRYNHNGLGMFLLSSQSCLHAFHVPSLYYSYCMCYLLYQ